MKQPEHLGVPHPPWKDAVDGLLGAIESGRITRDQAIPEVGQVIAKLYRDRIADNLGELQGYLRGRRSPVQLVAIPFDPADMPRQDIVCIDTITNEPRSHYLQVSVGFNGAETEAETQLRFMSSSFETNELELQRNTGFLSLLSD